MRRAVAVFVLVLATLPLMITSARAQAGAPTASLQDLSWLAGHWVGNHGQRAAHRGDVDAGARRA